MENTALYGNLRTGNFSCSTIWLPGWRTLLYTGNCALATLVAQLFGRPDGEHCFIRERALATFLLRQQRSCSLTHSRDNRTVDDDDRMHMFQSVRAQWQLNNCLLAAVRCTNFVSCVIRLCLSSKMLRSKYGKWREDHLFI
jgi:hypothetical protein